MHTASVDRFHAFLLWPLELRLPERLRVLAKQENFVGLLSSAIAEGGVWEPVDPYNRCNEKDPDSAYSEFVYLHPFAQRVLYPAPGDKNPALAILKRTAVQKVEIGLRPSGTITLDVDRVHLYLFRSQTAMLVLEVSSTSPLELKTVLRFADQFRRAYSPFHEKGQAEHCPLSIKWSGAEGALWEGAWDAPAAFYKPVEDGALRKAPMAAHWQWLIQPLIPAGNPKPDAVTVEYLEDDRIASMLYLSVDQPFAISRGDMMRVCFCDEGVDSRALPYSERFLENFEAKYCYDRFWNPPPEDGAGSYFVRKDEEWRNTRYLCAGYNFAVIKGADDYEPPTRNHFRHHYLQLGILAHFHRASLLRYSRRLSEASTAGGKKLQAVRKEFAEFINQYWFREISNQEQGKELFKLWSERLGNRALLEQLSREAAAVDGILGIEEAEKRHEEVKKLQDSTDRLTRAIFWLAGLTLVVAGLDAEWFRDLAKWWGHWFIKGQREEKEFWLWLALALTSIAGLAIGVRILRWVWFRKLYAKEESRADQD